MREMISDTQEMVPKAGQQDSELKKKTFQGHNIVVSLVMTQQYSGHEKGYQ
jgi:hypothetical protein